MANGDNDVMVASSHSHDLAKRIPNAKLTIYPDSGHGGIFQYHRAVRPRRPRVPRELSSTVKAYLVEKYKSPMKAGEAAEPTVGDRDVLVDIHAAGVNMLDAKIRDGEFKLFLPYKAPFVLGHDLAGVVTRVGSGGDALHRG